MHYHFRTTNVWGQTLVLQIETFVLWRMLSRNATFCLQDAQNSSLGGSGRGLFKTLHSACRATISLELLFQIPPQRKPTTAAPPLEMPRNLPTLYLKRSPSHNLPCGFLSWVSLLSLGPPRNALCRLNLYLLILNLARFDWLHWQRVLNLVCRNFSLWWLDMPPSIYQWSLPPGWKTDTVYCLIHLHLQSFQYLGLFLEEG